MTAPKLSWTKLTDDLYVSACTRFSITVERHRRTTARFESSRNQMTRETILTDKTTATRHPARDVRAAKALASALTA